MQVLAKCRRELWLGMVWNYQQRRNDFKSEGHDFALIFTFCPPMGEHRCFLSSQYQLYVKW